MTNIELVLNPKNLTKSQITEAVMSIEEQINSGDLNPLDAYMKTKYVSDLCASITKTIKSYAEAEINKYSKGDREKHGAKFDIRSGYKKYDYSQDEEYSSLLEQLKQREELLKEAAKAHEKGRQVVDESGEIVAPLLLLM